MDTTRLLLRYLHIRIIDGKIFFNEVKLAKDDESVFDHSLHLCGTRFSTILKTART